MKHFSETHRVPPGKKIRLGQVESRFEGPFETKEQAYDFTHETIRKIRELQYRMFVEGKQSLLIVLQAPDAAGKDGVIRNVLGHMNPQGCRTYPFKVPTEIERGHDFLWRIHACTPAAGQVAIFNRSHYEDVLVVRVNKLVPDKVWRKRFAQINAFEELLSDAGTTILKLYLHISHTEQLERFKARLDEPDKHWKLNVSDYEVHDDWDEYRKAYEDVFAKCNSDRSPWYVVPSDRKWYRNAAVADIVLRTLESMDPKLPSLTVDLEQIRTLYDQALERSQQS